MLTPEEIADKTTEVGIQKSKLTTFKMLLLGILAGMFIALAGAGSILGNVYGGKLIGALIFPIGLCNVLVRLAVWMATGAKTMIGKIAAIFGPIMLFVLCGFEHSVANMFYGPAGIIMSARSDIAIEGLSAGSFLLNNLLPVTIGNIIGGAGIVGCSYFLIYSKKNKPSRV